MAFVVSELLKIKGTNLLIRFAPLQFNCAYFNSIYNRCQQIRYIFFRFVYSYNMKYNRRIFLVILSYSIQCSSDQEHTNISKKTSYDASKESFEIVSGSSVLFSSPPFSNNQQYMYEICLNTSSNHIFTLVMGDSSG